MLAAIIGLVGALAGVVTGAVLTELRDHRRNRQVRRDEAAVAARLVLHELQTNQIRVVAARGEKAHVERDAWQQHRGVLARQLDERAWGSVAVSYATLELAAGQIETFDEKAGRAIKRAEANLRALSDWARDSSDDAQMATAYLAQLEKMAAAMPPREEASRSETRTG